MADITQGWNLAIGGPTGDILRACDERTSGEMGSESPLGVGSRDNGMGQMTRTLEQDWISKTAHVNIKGACRLVCLLLQRCCTKIP